MGSSEIILKRVQADLEYYSMQLELMETPKEFRQRYKLIVKYLSDLEVWIREMIYQYDGGFNE